MLGGVVASSNPSSFWAWIRTPISFNVKYSSLLEKLYLFLSCQQLPLSLVLYLKELKCSIEILIGRKRMLAVQSTFSLRVVRSKKYISEKQDIQYFGGFSLSPVNRVLYIVCLHCIIINSCYDS